MKKLAILALLALTACETTGEADRKVSAESMRQWHQENARKNAAAAAEWTPADQQRADEITASARRNASVTCRAAAGAGGLVTTRCSDGSEFYTSTFGGQRVTRVVIE